MNFASRLPGLRLANSRFERVLISRCQAHATAPRLLFATPRRADGAIWADVRVTSGLVRAASASLRGRHGGAHGAGSAKPICRVCANMIPVPSAGGVSSIGNDIARSQPLGDHVGLHSNKTMHNICEPMHLFYRTNWPNLLVFIETN